MLENTSACTRYGKFPILTRPPSVPALQLFESWCASRCYLPDTASFSLLFAFLESLVENNVPAHIITAMCPALQYAHSSNFAPGECAAASEPFNWIIGEIRRRRSKPAENILPALPPGPAHIIGYATMLPPSGGNAAYANVVSPVSGGGQAQSHTKCLV